MSFNKRAASKRNVLQKRRFKASSSISKELRKANYNGWRITKKKRNGV
jgi:hypothetical protein